MNPAKRSDVSVCHLNDFSAKFETVAALCVKRVCQND